MAQGDQKATSKARKSYPPRTRENRRRKPRFRVHPLSSQDWFPFEGGASLLLSMLPDGIQQPMKTEEDLNRYIIKKVSREKELLFFFFFPPA